MYGSGGDYARGIYEWSKSMRIQCADEGLDLFPDTELPELFYEMEGPRDWPEDEEAETTALCLYLVRSCGRILV